MPYGGGINLSAIHSSDRSDAINIINKTKQTTILLFRALQISSVHVQARCSRLSHWLQNAQEIWWTMTVITTAAAAVVVSMACLIHCNARARPVWTPHTDNYNPRVYCTVDQTLASEHLLQKWHQTVSKERIRVCCTACVTHTHTHF